MEERNSRIQTHPCLCVKSQPICAPQETRRWGGGGQGKSVAASEYLGLLPSGCVGSRTFPLRLAVDSVFYSNANPVSYRVEAERSLSGHLGELGTALSSNWSLAVKQAQGRPQRRGCFTAQTPQQGGTEVPLETPALALRSSAFGLH